jgi:hypothetical protein
MKTDAFFGHECVRRFSRIATEALSGRLEHTRHATCMQLNDGLSSKYDVIISNVEMSNHAPDAVAGSHLLMQTVLHYAKLLGGWKIRPTGSDASSSSVILHCSSSAVAEGIIAQYCANNQLDMTRHLLGGSENAFISISAHAYNEKNEHGATLWPNWGWW